MTARRKLLPARLCRLSAPDGGKELCADNEVIHWRETSPRNPLGFKGLGEGGDIAPPVVITNAVCDALRRSVLRYSRHLCGAVLAAAMAFCGENCARDYDLHIELDGISNLPCRDGSTTLPSMASISISAMPVSSRSLAQRMRQSIAPFPSIAGLIEPSSGRVSIDGACGRAPTTDVGIVFQRRLALDWRNRRRQSAHSVRDARPRSEPHRDVHVRSSRPSARGFETKHPWSSPVACVSGVAICRALIHDRRSF